MTYIYNVFGGMLNLAQLSILEPDLQETHRTNGGKLGTYLGKCSDLD